MSSITPPADDLGLQSLRQSNKADSDIKPVSRLAATRAIHQSTGTPVTSSLYTNRRQRLERRSEDRRRHKQNVLLDTRSYHDRRTTKRRGFTKKRKLSHTRGINIKV
ncbi:hypothetical protein MNBD_GAMMA24-1663 [hydrothermal vent metagenome]|uniref:Uncharacterized protein n=1 Tax=hydrothermal vent metagenome TaxID=652676 RepID=A0A3B1C1Z0_9ZZZZ